MNALLVIAHPNEASFSHAMAAVARSVLAAAGCVVFEHDLYAEGFNPVQQLVESANTSSTDLLVEQHCDHLRNADLILIFHPNWWSQPPAIMKGWIDRIFRLDTAYGYPDGVGYDGLPMGLLKARYALVFNTSNTPAQREKEVFGDPLDALWRTSVFSLCGVNDVKRRMFGPMASSTESQRASWLNEVRDVVQYATASLAQSNR
jgi:NAD(P)H dehydrogenase (quinone)